MTYLDFINLFNRYDREQRFSDGASRLYIKLLDVANEINRNRPKGAPWIIDFQRSDGYVAGVYGCSVNTVKKHRDELVERGLVSGEFGQSGRNARGKYHLYHPDENLSKVDIIPEVNVSKVDTIPKGNISSVDTISPLNLSTSDTISPENPLNVSTNVSTVDTLYIEEEREVVDAADAATSPSLNSDTSESQLLGSPKKGKGKNTAKPEATAEEIAALPLPHAGAEFAELWTNFLKGSKQAGKTLYAFQLMLKHLGKKPEAFACVMLERATVGNWQGVENPGTARDFQEWQAEQARRPTPAPPSGPPVEAASPVNPEAIAEKNTRAAADLAARQAAFHARQGQSVAAS